MEAMRRDLLACGVCCLVVWMHCQSRTYVCCAPGMLTQLVISAGAAAAAAQLLGVLVLLLAPVGPLLSHQQQCVASEVHYCTL